MGDDNISKEFHGKLQQYLDDMLSALVATSEAYSNCLTNYSNTLQKSIDGGKYQSQNDLMKLHQSTKTEAKAQVCT